MISHRALRKNPITRKHRPVPQIEFLENRQLLSTAHAAPFYNLTGAFVPVTLPREINGQPMTGAITIAVKNAGTLALPAVQKITIRLVAHSTTRDVTLSTSSLLSISSLAAGASKNVSIDLAKATVPPVGDYTLRAVITPTPALKESSTADNVVTTTAAQATIPLLIGAPDLTGTLLPSTLPALIQANSKNPVQGTLTVQIKNNGTAPLPAHEQITLQIRAHNVLTGKNYILNANPNQKFSVDALGIGQTLSISPNLQFKGNTFPAGSYTLQALITPVQPFTESNTTNNLVTANAAGQPTTLVSQTALAPDLTGLFGNSTVQATANGTVGNLTITLTNNGTAAVIGTHALSFAITARPNNPFMFDVATPVVTLPQHFSIKNLQAGQSATFTVGIDDEPIALGSWEFTAAINVTDLPGPTAGNLITVNKSGALITLTSNNANATLGQAGIADFNPIAPAPLPVLLNAANLTIVTQNPVITSAPVLPITAVLDKANLTVPTPVDGSITTGGVLNLSGTSGTYNLIEYGGPLSGFNDFSTLTITQPTGGVLNVNGGATINTGTGTLVLNAGNPTVNSANLTVPTTGAGSATLSTGLLGGSNVTLAIIGNSTLPSNITINNATPSNGTLTFTGTLNQITISNLTWDTSLTDGSLSLANFTQNGLPFNLDFNNIISHTTRLVLTDSTHVVTIDVGSTGTGIISFSRTDFPNVVGTPDTFTAVTGTSNSLTFTLTPSTL